MRRVLWVLVLLIGAAVWSMLSPRAPRSEPAATYTGSEACEECHANQYRAWQRGGHGRASRDSSLVGASASCESCHGPGSLHVAADNDKDDPGFDTMRKFSKMPVDEANRTCLGCHQTGDQFYWEHSKHAARGVACIQCHSMHDSHDPGGAAMLKAGRPSEQCMKCHLTKKLQVSKSAHMPLREGGMECSSCHNPHGAPSPHQIRAASVNELCEKCHADKRGPMLWEHAPVRENCSTCHEPHGANNDKLLTGKKPFLCQRCHIATRHPSNLYDFPDLASNRLTNRSCTNCHTQIHGSNHPSGQFFLR